MCIDKLSSHSIRNVQQQAWEFGNKSILVSQPKLWFETNNFDRQGIHVKASSMLDKW
jgi:hypothetical protein